MTAQPTIKLEGRALEIAKALGNINEQTRQQSVKLEGEMKGRWAKFTDRQNAAAAQLMSELEKIIELSMESNEIDMRYMADHGMAFVVPKPTA